MLPSFSAGTIDANGLYILTSIQISQSFRKDLNSIINQCGFGLEIEILTCLYTIKWVKGIKCPIINPISFCVNLDKKSEKRDLNWIFHCPYLLIFIVSASFDILDFYDISFV